jgi:hypothetical protein
MTRPARYLRSIPGSRAVVSLIGASAAALIVWLFGPLVSIGGWTPLDGSSARLLAVVAISLLWGAGNLWSAHRTHAGGEAMVEALAKPSPGPADAELGAIAARFKEVMARLKAHRFAKGRLYQLPWYLLIGPPGSGKTTALLQSGLRFPLEGLQELQGVGGTRHCDWFFTDEAVLLAGIVDHRNMRVAQSPGSARLAQEADDGLGFMLPFRLEHLERDMAVVLGVIGLVHHRHPTLPKQAKDFVAVEPVPVARPLPMGR